jgi:hypothetical protein
VHFVTKCSCGAIIAQCRCPSFNNDKHVTTVERGCQTCHGTELVLEFPKPPFEADSMFTVKDGHGTRISATFRDWKYIYDQIHELFHGKD